MLIVEDQLRNKCPKAVLQHFWFDDIAVWWVSTVVPLHVTTVGPLATQRYVVS